MIAGMITTLLSAVLIPSLLSPAAALTSDSVLAPPSQPAAVPVAKPALPAPEGSLAHDPSNPYRLVIVDVPAFAMGALAGLDVDVVGPTPDGQGVEVVAQNRELAILAESGFSYSVNIPDLETHYASRMQDVEQVFSSVGGSITPAFGQGSMGGYHNFTEVVSILDQLSAQYPQIMGAKVSLGQSIEGRDVWAVKISDNPGVDENEAEVRFDSLHHAREPMSMESSLYYMIWLLENYGTDPLATFLVNERETWFVPVVNPDGYVYNETTNPNGGGMWRKNRRNNPGSSFGVDLNRNYPFRWGFDDSGSSPSASSSTYRGTAPASEPEVQAMVAFFASRNFRTALSSHSYSNLWLAPWGYDNIFPPDHADLQEVGALATASSGFPFGPAFVLLYPANGVTVDEDYGPNDTFSWTPEIGSSSQGFWPPVSNIVPLADSVLEGFQTTALSAGDYLRHRGSTLTDLGDGDGKFEPGETVGVSVNVRNSGRGAGVAGVTLGSTHADLNVTSGNEALGSIAGFTSADNAAAPLLMTIDAGATPGSTLSFDSSLVWDGPTDTVGGSLMVSAPDANEWTNLGGGSIGINGVPSLTGMGTLVMGTSFQLDGVNLPSNTPMLAWLSFSSMPLNVLGGTLHANPMNLQFFRLSDGGGAFTEGGTWPGGLPMGTDLYLQLLVQDLSVPADITLSNGVMTTTP